MKRKTPPPAEPVISPALLEQAKLAVQTDTIRPQGRCFVCASDCALNTASPEDQLCWVCRRLKISAWRDPDHQISAPE